MRSQGPPWNTPSSYPVELHYTPRGSASPDVASAHEPLVRQRVCGWRCVPPCHTSRAPCGAGLPAQRPVFRAATDLVTRGCHGQHPRRSRQAAPHTRRVRGARRRRAAVRVVLRHGGRYRDRAAAAPGLMFDTSGSMGDDIQLARTAAIKFLNTLPEAVDVTLVDFDTEVRAGALHPGRLPAPRRADPRRASPRASPRCTTRSASTSTASADDDGRTILVVFTDGGDTRSALRFSRGAHAAARVRRHGVFDRLSCQQPVRERPAAQRRVADASWPRNPAARRSSRGRCATSRARTWPSKRRSAVSTRWGISRPTRPATGAGASVDVRVRREGLRGRCEVRTRRGYFAPYSEEALIPCGTIMRWPDRRRPPLLPCHQVRTRSSSSATSKCGATRCAPCPSWSRG